jgi:hypothetical protein
LLALVTRTAQPLASERPSGAVTTVDRSRQAPAGEAKTLARTRKFG